MDQGTLVSEQINAGAEFINRLDRHVRVRAAFWLKESELGSWCLYIVSDQVNETSSMKVAYAEVAQVARAMSNPNLDVYRIRLVGLSNPLAQAALDVHQRCAARVPVHLKDRPFGDVYADEVYVYPLPPTGADAEKWRGVSIVWWPESSLEGAYWVEFRHEPLAMVPWPGGPRRVPRPAQVLVKDGQVIEYRPPENGVSQLTQSDYEKKAIVAVTPEEELAYAEDD